MDFEALHSANFKTLDDAVDGWTKMLDKLTDLKKDAKDGLHGKASKANWAGYNATVSREFIGKTAEEFNDAYTQAESIRNIIRDTQGELKTQQRLLKEAIERGRGNHMSVKSAGSGFTVTPNPDPKPANGQKDVDELRGELQGILNTATEIDSTASTSLKALVDLTDYGFSGQKYADRDSAANAIKEAENLARIAKKNPEDLTVKEFDALNAGLKKYWATNSSASASPNSWMPRERWSSGRASRIPITTAVCTGTGLNSSATCRRTSASPSPPRLRLTRLKCAGGRSK